MISRQRAGSTYARGGSNFCSISLFHFCVPRRCRHGRWLRRVQVPIRSHNRSAIHLTVTVTNHSPASWFRSCSIMSPPNGGLAFPPLPGRCEADVRIRPLSALNGSEASPCYADLQNQPKAAMSANHCWTVALKSSGRSNLTSLEQAFSRVEPFCKADKRTNWPGSSRL